MNLNNKRKAENRISLLLEDEGIQRTLRSRIVNCSITKENASLPVQKAAGKSVRSECVKVGRGKCVDNL